MGSRWNDSGISTVVGLILILGLIVSVAAVIKLAYIPDVKKQLEADHMQHVIGDIGDFKTQIDMLQSAASTGIGYSSGANVEMGGGGIPGIDPSTTSGTLTMDPAYGAFTITAYNDSGAPMSFGSATAIGRLVYQSNNRYFADQDVSYESGMVILAQPGGSVMLAPPSFTVLTDLAIRGRPVISFNPIRLGGAYQSFSATGTGTVRTSLLPGSSFFVTSTNITNITFTITSGYAPLWFSFLSSSMAGSGVPAANYTLTSDANTVTLFIRGKNASFSMIDSSFGAAMGYGYLSPGTLTGTPTSTPTPQVVTADFTANITSGPAPLAVAFTDLSTGMPTTWQWNFGDGSPNATVGNPVHRYSAPGTYTVTLTACNATGSMSTKTMTGYVTVTGTYHHLTVTSDKYSVGVNEWFNVTVTAYDSLNNVMATYSNQINLASDASAGHYHTEQSYTFVPATDAGAHTFNNQYYSRSGTIRVTVKDTTTGITYSSPLITVA